MKTMDTTTDYKISMCEARIVDLDLDEMNYEKAADLIKKRDFTILYECFMKVLTKFQRDLYDKAMTKVPADLKLFSDPIVLSFALQDACDTSDVEYVWLDLEGENEVGCSVWVKEQDKNTIIQLARGLLQRHIEKYLLDAYDHVTREDLARVFEAGLGLQECLICGAPSPERGYIVVNKSKLRGWNCKHCKHRTILPSDALDYLKREVQKPIERSV